MRRLAAALLILFVAALSVVTLIAVTRPADAATTCQLSVALAESTDPVNDVARGFVNRLVCYVNLLRVRANNTAQLKRVCSTEVTVPAATRQLVTIAAGATLTSSNSVHIQSEDNQSPPMLIDDGLEALSGTTIRGWLFNRATDASRTGRLCALVVTP